MKKTYLLTFVFIFSIFFTPSVYAANQIPGWDFVAQALAMTTGMPASMFDTLPEFLFQFLIPFLLIWFICLGFMKQLRIFTRAPNWIDWFISFSMAALTVYPTGIFLKIVTFFAGLSGTIATLAYFGMFILGVIAYTIKWSSPQLGSVRYLNDLQRDEKELRRKMDDARNKYAKKKNPSQSDEQRYLTHINTYRKQITDIQNKRKNIANE